jgi:hypothetical protein
VRSECSVGTASCSLEKSTAIGHGSPPDIRRNYREKPRYHPYSILPADFPETKRSVREGSSATATCGRVRMWRGGLRFGLSVAAPFGWRCLNSRTITPFPHPSHRTGHADFPHPALGQNSCLCTRKVIRSSPDPQHRAVLPRRAPTERSAHNRQCHHLGGHSLPGSQSEFFLRFRMWRLPPLPHITGVS